MSEKQITALHIASQKKQQKALAKTEQAIAQLIRERQKITVRAVARLAGVSVSYIYKYPELAYRIQTLREQQKYDVDDNKILPSTTSKKLKQIELENQRLTSEIRKLKNQIECLGKKDNSLSELQSENLRLQTENQELKQELVHTKKHLQQARDFILSQSCKIHQEQLGTP